MLPEDNGRDSRSHPKQPPAPLPAAPSPCLQSGPVHSAVRGKRTPKPSYKRHTGHGHSGSCRLLKVGEGDKAKI